MRFDNTEHCTLSDRIRIVGRELFEEYFDLTVDDAMKIAALCDVVYDEVDADVIFRRYYYMLFVLRDNVELSKRVYSDMCKYCKDCLNDRLNCYLYEDLEKYFNGEIKSFPIIGDYYGDE